MSHRTEAKPLPNYSTHAVEFFRSMAAEIPGMFGCPADFELFLADYLEEAIKFLLPDNGYLFADHDYKPAMYDLLMLPYLACALEFTAGIELHAQNSGLLHAPKRIALCFDPRQLPPQQKSRLGRLLSRPDWERALPEQALCVMAVFSAEQVWSSSVGLVVIDLKNDRPVATAEMAGEPISNITARVAGRIGAKKLTRHGLPVTFWAFPERSAMMGLSPEQATENLYIDTIDEVRTMYEFLAAVNCSNVGSQVLRAPKMLNAKRSKKGKTPFFDYRVLDIAPYQDSPAAPDTGAGAHAAPRTHLRRGHLRRLGERFGRKVLWINATVVNPGSPQGRVDKAYRVQAESPPK